MYEVVGGGIIPILHRTNVKSHSALLDLTIIKLDVSLV